MNFSPDYRFVIERTLVMFRHMVCSLIRVAHMSMLLIVAAAVVLPSLSCFHAFREHFPNALFYGLLSSTVALAFLAIEILNPRSWELIDTLYRPIALHRRRTKRQQIAA